MQEVKQEGELKKQMDFAYNQIRKMSGDVNWTKQMLIASKEILDEAKKDFPKMNLGKDDNVLEKSLRFNNAVWDWLKKWFGSE